MPKPGEKVRIDVLITKSIEPFYTQAQEIIKESQGPTAEPIVLAQRLSAIKTDEAWEEVANVVRNLDGIQIEAEATGFNHNLIEEEKSKVIYTVALKFNERYTDVKTKTFFGDQIRGVLSLKGFTFKDGAKW